MQCRRDESKFAARQYFTRTFTRVTSGCTGIHCNKVYSALDFKFLRNNNFCMMLNYYKISLCQLQGVVDQVSKQPLTDSLATGTAGFKHCKHRRVETAGAVQAHWCRAVQRQQGAVDQLNQHSPAKPDSMQHTYTDPTAHLLILLATYWSCITLTDPTAHLLILLATYWSYITLTDPTAHLLILQHTFWSYSTPTACQDNYHCCRLDDTPRVVSSKI